MASCLEDVDWMCLQASLSVYSVVYQGVIGDDWTLGFNCTGNIIGETEPG